MVEGGLGFVGKCLWLWGGIYLSQTIVDSTEDSICIMGMLARYLSIISKEVIDEAVTHVIIVVTAFSIEF